MTKQILVVGLGEVGSAIAKVEREAGNHVWIVEKDSLVTPGTSITYGVMHICIPYSTDFVRIISNYYRKYRPSIVIIHSTVALGTTEQIKKENEDIIICHSPVRGIHPNLFEGVMTFTKYVGADDELSKELCEEHLKSIGLNTHCMPSSNSTEAGKLLDTSYYGWCIMFAKEVKKYCDENGLDYNEVYTHANNTYNEGYTKLGKHNVVRPVLFPPEGPGVGGHCVQQNYELLPDSMLKKAFKEINESDYAVK